MTTTNAMSRIAADSKPVLLFTVILTVAVALASFALSFSALRDAALWGRVPGPLAFLVPVVIDASVLVYGLVALVLKARGRSAVWAWTLMVFFTVISIGANAAHAYDVPGWVKVLVGVVLVALAPLSVLTSTHALALLVIADHTPVPVGVTVEAGDAVHATGNVPDESAGELEPAPVPEPAPASPAPASDVAPVAALGPVSGGLLGPVRASIAAGVNG